MPVADETDTDNIPDCLRDIGLDRECYRLGISSAESMVHTRWSNTMAGDEYARIYSWGNDPKRKVSLPRTTLWACEENEAPLCRWPVP